MNIIINGGREPRKEPSNLPKRESNGLVRERLGARRSEREAIGTKTEKPSPGGTMPEELLENDSLRFDGVEESEAPEQDDRDIIAEYLSSRDAALTESQGEEDLAEDMPSWRHSRWAPLVFVAAVMVLFGILYVASHADHSLAVERVSVSGATLLSEREVLELANVDRKAKFYDIDLKQLQHRLLTHSLIKSAHPRRELNPATIVLDIEERQPVAMLRSSVTGEAFIIDGDGLLLQPKLIAGLRDPAKLMQVPLLSGVSEHDTAVYQYMARMVARISAMDSGALRSAIGELRRTPNGTFVIFTPETQTPIFIGAPGDTRFVTATEQLRAKNDPAEASASEARGALFNKQLHLLAHVWKNRLGQEVRTNGALYVDARFDGQIVLRHRGAAMGALRGGQPSMVAAGTTTAPPTGATSGATDTGHAGSRRLMTSITPPPAHTH